MSVNKVSRSSSSRLFPRHAAFVLLFTVVLLIICLALFLTLKPWASDQLVIRVGPKKPIVLHTGREIVLTENSPVSSPTNEKCGFYNCLNVYRCGRLHPYTLSVYVYPLTRYLGSRGELLLNPISKEYHDILVAIIESPYYTSDPEKACLLVPDIDTLNQNGLNLQVVGQALSSLPYWNGGENHLLFNMLPGTLPNYSTVLEVPRGNSLLAGGGFSSLTYRREFDVSIPVFNPLLADTDLEQRSDDSLRKWFVVVSQTNIHHEFKQDFLAIADEHPELLVLDHCNGHLSKNYSCRCHGDEVYPYPTVLQDSIFCVVVRGARLGQTTLLDAMMAGCIPVVVADLYVLPFSEVLDWKRAAVLIYEDEIPDMMYILKGFSDERISEMRGQVHYLWKQYFSTTTAIATTTLNILNDRIFPHTARSYEDWNDPPAKRGPRTPLFLPTIAPKSQGFTAVILTYDRLESLFQVMQNVVKAPSLAKVLVVWNNQNKPPPQASIWPKIDKPLKVVQKRENKLSNRFFPYDEIETEAILAIDDDIVMLTADELEFGFEVWREFPDRIVGFPSRVHLWDNGTHQWKYQSEWTNEVSMVLTGVAFYHKFWSYMYTTGMPKSIKTWVDDHMNCEDIAMNFLVTNMTGKAPIKVAPRKKFKCPECTNTEMLSSDLSHMMERSKCINTFAEMYGYMPLKPVEFRADPVLYKDSFPEKLKRFNNIGSL